MAGVLCRLRILQDLIYALLKRLRRPSLGGECDFKSLAD